MSVESDPKISDADDKENTGLYLDKIRIVTPKYNIEKSANLNPQKNFWRVLNLPKEGIKKEDFIRSFLGTLYLMLTIFFTGFANVILISTYRRLGFNFGPEGDSLLVEGFSLALQIIPGALLLGGSITKIVSSLLGRVRAEWFSSIVAPIAALFYFIIVIIINTALLPHIARTNYIPSLQDAIDRRDIPSAERYVELAIRFYSFDLDDILFPGFERPEGTFPTPNQDPNNSPLIIEIYSHVSGISSEYWPTLARYNIARLYELEGKDLDKPMQIYETILQVEGCWLFAAWQFGELVNYNNRLMIANGQDPSFNRALSSLSNAIYLSDNKTIYDEECGKRYRLSPKQSRQLRYWLHMTRGETFMMMGEYLSAKFDFDTAALAIMPLDKSIDNLKTWVREDHNQSSIWNGLIVLSAHRAFIKRLEVGMNLGQEDYIQLAKKDLCTYIKKTKEEIKISSWLSQDLIDYTNLGGELLCSN